LPWSLPHCRPGQLGDGGKLVEHPEKQADRRAADLREGCGEEVSDIGCDLIRMLPPPF